jgi:PHD/YefM family antitoxin component YafN of YafNO toxin-antitoxin module
MVVDLKGDIVSLTDFARNTRDHTEAIRKSGGHRVLTQNGKAALVVLSVEACEELAHAAEEHRLDARLRQALADHAAGERGEPADVVLAKVRRNAARRRRAK